MSEEEFNLGFADEHDDWGQGVDPKNLNTLRCLNSHRGRLLSGPTPHDSVSSSQIPN